MRRVELKVDRSRVAVSLKFDTMQVKQLSLSEVVALKAALKGKNKSSDRDWLKSCHAGLHGPCAGCTLGWRTTQNAVVYKHNEFG